MSNLSPQQDKVFEAALEWLKKKPWFQGVCMDNFPTDAEIAENFDDCVNKVCMTTAYWDAPDFLNP